MVVRLRELTTSCHTSTERLKEDISNLQKNNNELRSSLHDQDSRASVMALGEEITIIKDNALKMTEEIMEVRNADLSFQIKLENSSDIMKGVIQEIEDLKSSADDLQSSLRNISSHDVIVTLQKEILHMRNDLNGMNMSSSESSAFAARLETDIEAVNESFKTLQGNLAYLETMSNTITDQVRDFENKVNDSIAEWRVELDHETNETLQTVFDKFDTVNAKHDALLKTVNDALLSNKDVQDSIDDLKGGLEIEKSMNDKFDANIKQIEENMNKLDARINSTQETKDQGKVNSTHGTKDQAAFIARQPSNVNPDSSEILVFQTEELDTANAYDSTTGKFTAPVTGLYLFSVQMCIRDDSGIYYKIKSSGSQESHIAAFHGGNYYDSECSSATTVAKLTLGETIWVESGTTVGKDNEIYLDDRAWNMFTGILIHTTS